MVGTLFAATMIPFPNGGCAADLAREEDFSGGAAAGKSRRRRRREPLAEAAPSGWSEGRTAAGAKLFPSPLAVQASSCCSSSAARIALLSDRGWGAKRIDGGIGMDGGRTR